MIGRKSTMEVNIEQIMDEIRAEIQEKGLKNEIP